MSKTLKEVLLSMPLYTEGGEEPLDQFRSCFMAWIDSEELLPSDLRTWWTTMSESEFMDAYCIFFAERARTLSGKWSYMFGSLPSSSTPLELDRAKDPDYYKRIRHVSVLGGYGRRHRTKH